MLKELMQERQTAYSRIFVGDAVAAGAVMQDLRRFCRADSTTFHPDPRVHAALEGRREVVLRILDYTTLSIDDLCVKYGKAETND